MSSAILLISAPDTKGITAAVTDFIFRHQGNVLHADQHIDEQSNTFFMRIEWSLDDFRLDKEEIAEEFLPLAQKFRMTWDLFVDDTPLRVAVFVSKPLHCLYDLLTRARFGRLKCEIPLIISNHNDAKSIAAEFEIPFCKCDITPSNRLKEEAVQMKLLEEHGIDLVVLARYHQILSKNFIGAYPNRIINIHHSFLPAFAGKAPYRRAYEKGVKIIGATSHYVIEKLDAGPIIEQDTVRVSHRDSIEDLIEKGEDLEKQVLFRAVQWHLQRKILTYENKTVIFD